MGKSSDSYQESVLRGTSLSFPRDSHASLPSLPLSTSLLSSAITSLSIPFSRPYPPLVAQTSPGCRRHACRPARRSLGCELDLLTTEHAAKPLGLTRHACLCRHPLGSCQLLFAIPERFRRKPSVLLSRTRERIPPRYVCPVLPPFQMRASVRPISTLAARPNVRA